MLRHKLNCCMSNKKVRKQRTLFLECLLTIKTKLTLTKTWKKLIFPKFSQSSAKTHSLPEILACPPRKYHCSWNIYQLNAFKILIAEAPNSNSREFAAGRSLKCMWRIFVFWRLNLMFPPVGMFKLRFFSSMAIIPFEKKYSIVLLPIQYFNIYFRRFQSGRNWHRTKKMETHPKLYFLIRGKVTSNWCHWNHQTCAKQFNWYQLNQILSQKCQV